MLHEITFSKQYVEKLRDENQELLDELNALKDTFDFSKFVFPRSWRLYHTQRKALVYILKAHTYITPQRLHFLVSCDPTGMPTYSDYRSIYATCSHIRTQAKIELKCSRHLGYYIEAEEKQRIYDLCKKLETI